MFRPHSAFVGSALYRWVFGLCLAVAVLCHGETTEARPGMGAYLAPATVKIGPGGLVIDYSAVLKRRPNPPRVDWNASREELTIIGTKARTVPLTAWELNDLVHAVQTDSSGRIEVSVDVTAGGQHFYASSGLRKGRDVTSVGKWLQQGDLQFADIVMGSGAIDQRLGADVSPSKISLELLQSDTNYRKLTRDLVTRPSSWPTIYFEITELNAAEPRWRPDFQLRFYSPSLQIVSPEKNNTFLETWMVKEADRPFLPLHKAVTGKDRHLRGQLSQLYPALGAAERWASILPSLHLFCQRNGAQCSSWRSPAAALVAPPAPQIVYGTQLDARALHQRTSQAWDDARLEQAKNEADPEYKRWIFVDETIYSLRVKPRYSSSDLFSMLPEDTYGRGETASAVRLYEAAARVMFAGQADSHVAVDEFMSQVARIRANKQLGKRMSFWWESAGIAAISLQPLAVVDSDKERLSQLTDDSISECWDAMTKSANLAAHEPYRRSELDWRVELGRAERCRVDIMRGGNGPLIEGAFHFAIGWASANGGHLADARNRLRLLESMIVVTSADIQTSAKISSLAGRLRERLSL